MRISDWSSDVCSSDLSVSGAMTDGDKIARLRLIRSKRIGPVTYFQLLNRFGSAEAALSALPDLPRRGGGKAPRIATNADADRRMAAAEQAGPKPLFLGLPPFPHLLRGPVAPPPRHPL